LPRLEELHLDSTNLNDDAVAALSSLTTLRWLDLYHTLITEKGYQLLHSALPRCHIVWERDSAARRGI
jgi:hypothetical protein